MYISKTASTRIFFLTIQQRSKNSSFKMCPGGQNEARNRVTINMWTLLNKQVLKKAELSAKRSSHN